MIRISIPGSEDLALDHLVLDYNGTLALDGQPLAGVMEVIDRLGQKIAVHVITADTFGTVEDIFTGHACRVHIIEKKNQDRAKLAYVQELGCEKTACIGNGRNDCLMLEASALGMAVILREGAFAPTLASADLVFTSIIDALEILENPLRLAATLRN